MTDTLFADVSYYQCGVNDSYPHRFFAFRSNDGSGYIDSNFAHNYQWSVKACNSGKLDGFIVYYVWRDSSSDETHMNMIKDQGLHPKCASMQDVESWGGQMGGNQSSGINASRENLISKLYSGNRKRVINYANEGDRNSMCPSWGDTKWIIANYSYNPKLKDQIAHQYADNVNCAPFGPCDANSADGFSPSEFAAQLGLSGSAPAPAGDDMPKQIYLYTKSGQTTKLGKAGTWVTVGWDADLANTGGSSLSLPKGAAFFSMSAWLYCGNLPTDYNIYWRTQTLDGSTSKELAKFPIGEIVGTSGDSDLQFSQVGSVSTATQTNLRILVASTKDDTIVKQAWWRCLYW